MEEEYETIAERNERVPNFLQKLYGHAIPESRAYISSDDAQIICRDFLPDGFRAVTQDLEIGNFNQKWCYAIEISIRQRGIPTEWQFWHDVRKRFLRYGGCYKAGHQPPANE